MKKRVLDFLSQYWKLFLISAAPIALTFGGLCLLKVDLAFLAVVMFGLPVFSILYGTLTAKRLRKTLVPCAILFATVWLITAWMFILPSVYSPVYLVYSFCLPGIMTVCALIASGIVRFSIWLRERQEEKLEELYENEDPAFHQSLAALNEQESNRNSLI